MSNNVPVLDGLNSTLFYIYNLCSSKDNEIRYIGYTKDSLKERLRGHLKDAKKCKNHKDKWINKQIRDGYKIIIRKIDVVDDFNEALRKEIMYIRVYKNIGARLVNTTNGGEGMFGYKQSEEQKKRNSILKSKKIYYFNFNTGELLGEFPSLKLLRENLNISQTMARGVLDGTERQAKGFIFSYNNECPIRREKKYKAWNRGISTIGLQKHHPKVPIKISNNIEIIEFESISEVVKFFNSNISTVKNYLDKDKLYKGYKITRIK